MKKDVTIEMHHCLGQPSRVYPCPCAYSHVKIDGPYRRAPLSMLTTQLNHDMVVTIPHATYSSPLGHMPAFSSYRVQ